MRVAGCLCRRGPLHEQGGLQPDAFSLSVQITLLKYFRNYMSEHLLKAGANITPREGDELARLPYLRTWFRTRSAIVLHLSNGCVQINFFQVCWRQQGSGGQGCLPWAPPITLHLCPAPRTTPNSSCAP